MSPVDGKDIQLSIDSKVQFFAYQQVRDAVLQNRAKAGSVIVLDAERGDVLVSIGEMQVGSSLDLERSLLDRGSGERLPVVVRRAGAERKVELVLERARPQAADPF